MWFGGLVGSEKLTLNTDYTVDNARFTNKNAGNGNREVEIYASLMNTGATAKNYTLQADESPYTLTNQTIAQRPISIDAAIFEEKTYDGSIEATVKDHSVSFSGLVAGEQLLFQSAEAGNNILRSPHK